MMMDGWSRGSSGGDPSDYERTWMPLYERIKMYIDA